MRERDIEKHLVKRVKEAGGEVRKVKWIGRRGAPDRFVMLPEKTPYSALATCFWVELKAPGEKPTRAQEREHERMRKHGATVVVIDSIEGVEALLAGPKQNKEKSPLSASACAY